MSLRQFDFPYPVLRKDSLDYKDCLIDFKLTQDPTIQDSNIIIETEYKISCPSIEQLIKANQAKALLIAESSFASFREVFYYDHNKKLNIKINKDKVIKNINLIFQIVANNDLSNFTFPEHNKDFFKNQNFYLKKGDIIALGEEIIIKLDSSELDKSLSSIICVKKDPNVDSLHVNYDDEKIILLLRNDIYDKYDDLKKFNNGVFDTIIKSLLFLPVITEAVNDVKKFILSSEEFEDVFDLRWVKSIINKANKIGLDLQEEEDIFIAANKIMEHILEKSIESLHNIINKLINDSEIIEEGGND